MLKNLFNFICNYKMIFNPVIRYNASNIGEISGINELKRETQIVVSITSGEDRFDELELSLYSVFNQTISPDKVILWFSNEYELSELPYSITRYIKNGLEIRFVEDKKSFTNIIYALKEFENHIIITAEDNICYPKDWLKKLYHSYITNPKDIHVHRAFKVKTKENTNLPSVLCEKYFNNEMAGFDYIPDIYGGVLYPPKCFTREVFREDVYKKKAKADWIVWAWVMALVSGRKIRIVKNHIKILSCINFMKQFKTESNRIKHSVVIDNQISKLMEFYGQNITQRLNS